MKIPELSELVDLSRHHPDVRAAVEFAILRLEATMRCPKHWRRRDRTSEVHLGLRRDLPYRIHSTDLTGTQILINREQKPVGSNVPSGGKYLRYEDYPNSHVRLTPEQ